MNSLAKSGGRAATKSTRVARSAVPYAVAVAALLLGLVLGQFDLVRLTLWVIFGLLALSLDWVWGQGGIFSFGQTAFFGVAGYAYGVVAINMQSTQGGTTVALLSAVAVGAVMAGLLGYFMFYGRISDVYLAIITLAVTLVLLTFFGSTADPKYAIGAARFGGYNGMTGIPPLALGIPGVFDSPLSIKATYFFMVIAASVIFFLVRMLVRAPVGRILAAIRENELRAELLGYDVRRYKLLAFIVGGAIAGFAGAMYAAWGLFINPAVFSLAQAAAVIIWVLVGGRGTLVGAFLGVVVVEGLSTALGGVTSQTPLILGVILILIVLFVPNGLVSLWSRAASRLGRNARSTAASNSIAVAHGTVDTAVSDRLPRASERTKTQWEAGATPILETTDLAISFGGLQAVAGVTLGFDQGMHSLIGPNGAGKSTFFNLLVGRYSPSNGRIRYKGRDITGLKPHQRAQLGIGIKLQAASIFGQLSVHENLWLAAYACCRDRNEAHAIANAMLRQVALEADAHRLAAYLSHGSQQWLEIGMVLASRPELVLLDEPTSGMTREETRQTADLVKGLSKLATIVVVEHDMEFVRELGAPIAVFHEGKLFRRGTLGDLRRDEDVLNIYLGKRSHVAG
ncbi:MAG: ATP-binding cassette domain-containing protein [Actinobacteria bacterium]|nr:ATP-binding cassette domain-containing protein [Actinomycetota bacterium]